LLVDKKLIVDIENNIL
jgi:hypothetical protein